jgi:hypothetical protein
MLFALLLDFLNPLPHCRSVGLQLFPLEKDRICPLRYSVSVALGEISAGSFAPAAQALAVQRHHVGGKSWRIAECGAEVRLIIASAPIGKLGLRQIPLRAFFAVHCGG